MDQKRQKMSQNEDQKECQEAHISALEKKLVHVEAKLKLNDDQRECQEARITALEKKLVHMEAKLKLIMESDNEPLTINSLPDEMLINVFSYMSQNELGKIARVSRRWSELTRSPDLWKRVDVKFHWTHKSQTTVAKDFVDIVPLCVTSIKLYYMNRDDWTGPFNFEELCVGLQRRGSHLEKLILEGVILSDSFPSVIDLCTRFLQGVKTLVFHRSRFADCPAGREFGTDSTIEVLDLGDCHLGQFDELQFPKIPQLCVLNLHYTGIGPKTFQSIRNNGLNLKELYLCGTYVRNEDLSFTKSLLPHLQKICLHHTCYVSAEGIVSVIQSCQSLQKVNIGDHASPVSMQSLAAHPFFVRNRYKFEIVIYGCHDSNVD